MKEEWKERSRERERNQQDCEEPAENRRIVGKHGRLEPDIGPQQIRPEARVLDVWIENHENGDEHPLRDREPTRVDAR